MKKSSAFNPKAIGEAAKGIDWKGPWGQIATAIVGSAIAATMGAFADEMIDWLKENKLKSKSKDYYEEMLRAHPALKKEDPKLVAQYWASLFHFAPQMAADPLSAGAFIRQSLDRGYPDLYGGPPIDTYSTLAGINKSVSESKARPGRFTGITDAAVGKLLGTALISGAGYGSTDKKKKDYGPLEMD